LSRIAGVDLSQCEASVAASLSILFRPGASKPRIWSGSRATLGAVDLPHLSHSPGLAVAPDGAAALALDGRLANAESLQDGAPDHSGARAHAAVVLDLIRREGIPALQRLAGGFALAFADSHALVLARDRLGIRPLYYGFRQGGLHFASEIKALVGLVDCVHEFPPGHCLLPGRGLVRLAAPAPEPPSISSPEDCAQQVRQVVGQAVDRALADTTMGVWLSGGVDSSVVAAAAKERLETLYTFSVGTAGSPDLEFARLVAQHLGTRHHERTYGLDDVLAVLEQVIYQLESFDAPLVRSAAGNYLVAQLAAEHVGHVLSGEGGDELFAGYAYQKECDPDLELTLSVQDAIAQLHHTALQRVDRSAAAHATQAEVPLLDPHVVRLSQAIPSSWKIRRGAEQTDKWPLRKAFEGSLPDAIVWRGKAKFWEGAGAATLVAQHAEYSIADAAFASERVLDDAPPLRSKEELLYYRIFRQAFSDRVPLAEVGRTAHV
jgi:asparagine synthase (glutamine-hydrolysing)